MGARARRVLAQLGPLPQDMERMRRGVRVIAELMFAAGAHAVIPAIHGLPARITQDQMGLLEDAPLDPRCYSMIATQLFGTARMGEDAGACVVDIRFQVHGVPGLYVVDSSFFPRDLGVNPEHTIMAVADIAAERMANR